MYTWSLKLLLSRFFFIYSPPSCIPCDYLVSCELMDQIEKTCQVFWEFGMWLPQVKLSWIYVKMVLIYSIFWRMSSKMEKVFIYYLLLLIYWRWGQSNDETIKRLSTQMLRQFHGKHLLQVSVFGCVYVHLHKMLQFTDNN